MLNRLICKFMGHKRGKREATGAFADGYSHRLYRCPRCKATWTRPVKAKGAA